MKVSLDAGRMRGYLTRRDLGALIGFNKTHLVASVLNAAISYK